MADRNRELVPDNRSRVRERALNTADPPKKNQKTNKQKTAFLKAHSITNVLRPHV